MEPTSRWREIVLGALDGFSKAKLQRPPRIRDDHDVTVVGLAASVLQKVESSSLKSIVLKVERLK